MSIHHLKNNEFIYGLKNERQHAGLCWKDDQNRVVTCHLTVKGNDDLNQAHEEGKLNEFLEKLQNDVKCFYFSSHKL